MKPRRAVLYLRVSRGEEQDPESQGRALRGFCAERGWQIASEHVDRISGDPARRRGDPPGLAAALRALQLQPACVLVVFAVDRLVRSPLELLQLIGRIRALGADLCSVSDGGDVDTTSDVGELLLFLRGWWARMELRLTRARTLAGLERAKQAGRIGGRRRVQLPDSAKVHDLIQRGLGVRRLAEALQISEWTAREAKKAYKRSVANGGGETKKV